MPGSDGRTARHAPPIATVLLPPGGKLAPPGGSLMAGSVSAVGQADPLLDGLGAGLTRAVAGGRVLAERARSTASEHAPEMRRRAAQAAGIAGQTAATVAALARARAVAARGAWYESGSTPGARRKLLAVGGAGLVALVAVVWIVAQSRATAAARVQVPVMLARAGLGSSLYYRSVTASPLGTIRLDGVTWRSGRTVLPITSVTIGNLISGASGLRRISIGLHDAAVPVRMTIGMLPYSLPPLLMGLGYVVPKLDGIVDVTMDDATQTLSLTAQIRSAQLGRLDAKLRLGGMTTSQLNGILAIAAARRAAELGQYSPTSGMAERTILQSLLGVTLQAAEIAIDDTPLAARAKVVPENATPSDTALTADDRVGEVMAGSLAGLVPPDRTEAARSLVAGWLRDGGRIVLRADPVAPVPMFRAGEFGQEVAPTLDDPSTAAQANVSIID